MGAETVDRVTSDPSPLQESEFRFRVATSQLPVVMWTTDTDLRFTWGTGAALGSLHMDPRMLVERPVSEFFPGDEGESGPMAQHRRALAGQSVRYDFEWLGRWFDVHLEPMRSSDGTVVGVIGIAMDITDRKRAEDALRLSEDRFQLLGRATSDMAWDWDLETDNIWRNENLLTVFGYSAEDMEPAGTWWEQRIHPEDRDRVMASLRTTIGGSEPFWSAEFRWQRKDGTYAIVLDRGYVIRDQNGKPIRMVGSTMDITRMRRDQQIREAIYRISEAGSSARDLPAFYAEVHKIVGLLMPAQNFYIALHDPETNLLSFPYFVDEEESTPAPYQAGRGLTEYVLRSGKPFYASTEGYERLVASGEVVRIGPMSIDWVGVPLIARGRTIGVLVVQTYAEGVRYGEEERDVLSYVSEQIAMAIERKRAEEAQRESEERYRMLFESNPTPMWVYDLETLSFLAVNDIAVEHYGYSREEFLSMTIKDIRPREYVDAVVASAREHRQAISRSGIWKHRTKDGRVLDVEITSHTLSWGGRPAVLVMANDVTARKRDEEALVAAESKFRSLVEQSLTGIYIIQDQHFVYVNPRFAEIHGYAQDEIIPRMGPLDLIAPEDRASAAENIRRCIEGELKSIQQSLHAVRKDGSRMAVEVQAGLLEFGGRPAIIGSVLDVTEREKAVDELRRSETRFRTLIEAAADAIVLVNEKGIILDANPAAFALVGMDRTELLGMILERFLLEEDLKRARTYLRRCFRDPTPPEPFEVPIVTATGHRKLLAVRSRLVSEAGTEAYVEMLIRDVTEQREMQRRLVASERLASVGQMAAYIAHEINTPLANISLLAAASKRRTQDPEVRERLDKIDAQRRQAAAIIADLLSFTKHREIQPEDVDLRVVIAAAIDQIDPYRHTEVELLADLGEQAVAAHVDPVQMQEVFVNLLRNAFEATAHGTVHLRLESQPGYRIVTIADTGQGIPEDVQARLFQPFVSTKRNKGGTGLGLALCKNIVTAHGGEIHFTTTVGKGTTFTVVLPQGAT
jgi:PAS domain S-box-containing protein